MKQKILLFVTALAFLVINSCTESITGPEPGRRDYVWTVDTIKIFSNNILQIWGSSPDDIWGVGPGGALNTTIWHYDGEKWSTDNISRSIAPECVFGFSKNDVWIAGHNGKIWHYDGIEWKESYQHKIGSFIGTSIYDLYGTSKRDLYAVGTAWFDNETRRGIILHYDGVKWTQKFLADFNSYFYKVRKGSDGKCFITCIKQDVKYYSQDTTIIYEYSQQSLIEKYSDQNKSKKGAWVVIIDGSSYFSLEDGIFRYDTNGFEKVVENNIESFAPLFRGRNEKDIFISKRDGIVHYNGNDIKDILVLESWLIDGLLFNRDIVFLVYNPYEGSLLYHGKLKE